MDWSNEQCLELIDVYSRYEVLWNPKNPYYFSKNKKNEAWDSIAQELSLETAVVKQKMQSLLGSFRAQKAKGKKSLASGNGTKDVYHSKWFAFERMHFLLDRNEPRETFDSQCDPLDVSLAGEDFETMSPDMETSLPVAPTLESTPSCSSQIDQPPDQAAASAIQLQPKKRKNEDPRIAEAFKILKRASEKVETKPPEDRFDVYGKYIANKMRLYSRKTEISVEHQINNILYQADLGVFDGYEVIQEENLHV